MSTNRFCRSDTSTRPRSRLQRPGCLLGLAGSLLLAGCVTTEPYRNQPYNASSDTKKELVCAKPEQEGCTDKVYYATSERTEEANAVHLAFVEFDDQGYLQNDKSVDEVLKRIKALAHPTKPLLMVVYAHGWTHNAKASDGDVEKFTRVLHRIALDDHKACLPDNSECHNREVVGVYLGWRGRATNAEPFNKLSFWSRKSRAHRVGIDGASQIVSALGAIRKQNNDQDEANGKHGHTQLFLIGHSFGAALMYSATQHLLLRDLAYSADGQAVKGDTADLVVLVNPAFEAARVHALWLAASKRHFTPEQHPLLAVFTSTADWETGFMFPLGRHLSTFWMPQTPDRIASETQSASNQRAENATTVGKYTKWQTHELTMDVPIKTAQGTAPLPPVPDASTMKDTACKWRSFQSGTSNKPWSAGNAHLTRVDGMQSSNAQRTNPYLFITTDGNIITSHSGIWNEQFSEFFYQFVAAQSMAANKNLVCNSIKAGG